MTITLCSVSSQNWVIDWFIVWLQYAQHLEDYQSLFFLVPAIMVASPHLVVDLIWQQWNRILPYYVTHQCFPTMLLSSMNFLNCWNGTAIKPKVPTKTLITDWTAVSVIDAPVIDWNPIQIKTIRRTKATHIRTPSVIIWGLERKYLLSMSLLMSYKNKEVVKFLTIFFRNWRRQFLKKMIRIFTTSPFQYSSSTHLQFSVFLSSKLWPK